MGQISSITKFVHPGRYIKKSDILEASKYERDQTVLNLRREFLGV